VTTADRILSAARDVYLSAGLQGFSMRKVAVRVGVSATALYRHYRNKEELIGSVINEGFRLFEQLLFEALPGKSPADRLQRSGLAYMRFGLAHPEYYRLIFMSTAHDHGFRNVTLQSPAKLSKAFMFLVDRVRECRDAGIVGGADPLELAAVLWSFWHGLVSLELGGHYRPVLKTRAEFEAFFARSSTSFIERMKP